MSPDQELEEAMQPDTQTFDMSAVEPQEHRLDRIVGNQLQCTIHENCVGAFVKPWEVLERNAEGELVLVSKLPE